MSNEKMTQKEYLRKYLSSGEDGKKKKKKKPKVGAKTVKIIDDDVDLKNMRPIQDGEFDIMNAYAEDAPQIVGVVDERGPVDFTDKRRWRIIAEDGDGNVAVSSNEHRHRDVEAENIVSGEFARCTSKRSKKSRESTKSDDKDLNPPRNRDDSEEDPSPPRNSRHEQSNQRASDTSDEDEARPRKKSKSRGKKSKKRRKDSTSESGSSSSSSWSSSESDASRPRRSKQQDNGRKKLQNGKRGPKSRAEASDLSPPREAKKRRDVETRIDGSSGRGRDERTRARGHSDGDLSPPRQSRHEDDRKKSQNGKRSPNSRAEDSDLSPPREAKKRRDFETRIDGNSGRQREERVRARGNSDGDLSPPREPKKRRDFEPSFNRNPKRRGEEKSRGRRDSDFDQSPPRRSAKNQILVEVHRATGNRGGSDSDLSPPRRSANDPRSVEARRTTGKRGGSDFDLSPPRLSSKKQQHEDSRRDSRPGRREDERNGKQRHRGKESSDARSGPPERNRRGPRSPRRKSRWNEERDRNSASPGPPNRDGDSRMKKTLDGKTAGLQDARALRIETEAHRKREADLFNKLSAEVSGVGQAAVLRDRKTGRRRDLAAEAAERREKEKRQEEIDEKYAKWGKGLKQVEDQEEKRARDQYEMSKPLARYADDADLDMCRKEELHAEDPMMEEIMERQIKEGTRKPERPSYQGSHMPNRFGIKPGHRWDGVDRSNGYEKRWFEARNARAAVQEEAYKWSTADM